jgi:hypothetical protein
MKYMVIEKFKPGALKNIYKRLESKGRLMPTGLTYVNSWISKDLDVCYQVMETSDKDLLDQWISNWSDLTDFDVVETLSSEEAEALVLA